MKDKYDLVVVRTIMKALLVSVLEECGVLCVMTTGEQWMLKLSVDN